MGTITRVGAIMCCAHRDLTTGQLHGHTWEVWASFPHSGISALVRQAELVAVLSAHDHGELPSEIAWAEDFAGYAGNLLAQCIAVDIVRPAERLSAHWTIDHVKD